MKRSLTICTLVGSALCLGALALATQPEKKPADTKPAQPGKPAEKPAAPAKPADKPAQPGTPSPEDQKKMWEEMARLTPEHERLKADFAGTFNADVKAWMEPGAAEPSASKGEMVNTMTHGGKFVHHEFKGVFEGMAFSGSGDFGFNKDLKRYEGTWMDNFGTMIVFSTGTYDAATKTYTSHSEFEMVNPMDGQKMKIKQRDVTKVESPDKHVMTMYHDMPGMGEMKVMEITFTRKK